MEPTLGINLINRTLRTTGILLLIFLPFGVYYWGVYPSLAVLSGGVWSIINLMFLARLVRAAIRPDGIDRMTVAGLGLIKFPLLYVAGYFLLQVPVFTPIPLVIGFSVPLAVIALKMLSRALLGNDQKEQNSKELHELR